MTVIDQRGNILGNSETWLELSEMDLSMSDFQGVEFAGGNLSDADLKQASFRNARLYGTYLYRANCADCDFRGAICQGAVFDEVDFGNSDLTSAKFISDNMGTPCTLRGANLKGAKLDHVSMLQCRYDDQTQFPPDFDPIAHGMVKAS